MRFDDTFGGRNTLYLIGGCLVLIGMVAFMLLIGVFFVLPIIQPRTAQSTATPATIDTRCRLIPPRALPAYFAPRSDAAFWANLNANESYLIIAGGGGGWYGFIPGVNDVPASYSLNQLRWVNPQANRASLTGNCDRVPLVDSDREPTLAPAPTFPQFPTATPTSNLPVDFDGDGVPDAGDLCPDEPGDAANNGCPPSG